MKREARRPAFKVFACFSVGRISQEPLLCVLFSLLKALTDFSSRSFLYLLKMGDEWITVNDQKGRILVYTGNGKGKTTAAIGLAVRAIGRDMKVSMLQFIKSPERTYGEKNVLEKLNGAEIHHLGVGFTWTKTPDEHRQSLKSAWKLAKEKIMCGKYNLVILDEINNALAIHTFPINDVLPIEEVIHTIKNLPPHVHVVLTGRDAKDEVKEIADLVSVINVEKHYYDEGVEAIYGIEY